MSKHRRIDKRIPSPPPTREVAEAQLHRTRGQLLATDPPAPWWWDSAPFKGQVNATAESADRTRDMRRRWRKDIIVRPIVDTGMLRDGGIRGH